MLDVHVHHVVHEAEPPVTARIVGDLLGRKPAHQRRPRVERGCVCHADPCDSRAHVVEQLNGDTVRVCRRLEVGDGALEQQLVSLHVLDTEFDEDPGPETEGGPRIRGPVLRLEALEQLAITLDEHRVVDRALRREVPVERGRSHADPLGDVPKIQPRQPFGAGDVPGCLEDLRRNCFAAFSASIAGWDSYHG